MTSVYKMVANRPDCITLAKQMEKYYAKKNWKAQMCSWQPV
jgi:hypothetical protein